jgi:ketosteroid isomerase-like protein
MSDKAAITTAFLDAFQNGDLDLARSMLTDDVEVTEPASLPYGGTWRGIDGFDQLCMKLGEAWEFGEFGWQVHGTDGDCTFHTGHLNATSRATGRHCDAPFTEKIEYRGDKICRITIYLADTAAALDALGIIELPAREAV